MMSAFTCYLCYTEVCLCVCVRVHVKGRWVREREKRRDGDIAGVRTVDGLLAEVSDSVTSLARCMCQ